MKFSYLLKLAIKNLMTRKLRTTLTVMGIVIGVGFIVFLVSLGFGLQRISTSEIANLDALKVIDVSSGKSKVIKVDDGSLEKFKKLANVTQVEPVASLVGKVAYKKSEVESVVYGKNIEYLKLEDVQLDRGSIYTSNYQKQAIVNKSILNRFGITENEDFIGEEITAKITLEKTNEAGETVNEDKWEKFKIIGVISDSGSPYIYVPLEVLKELGVDKYSGAKVMVTTKESVDTTKSQIENLGFRVTSLKNTVDQINQFFAIFQLILVAFGAIAVIIAVLGMFNTLTISLLERTREISFMKVMGATKKDVWWLFIVESIIIGGSGALIGVFSSVLISSSLNQTLISLAEKTGNKPVAIFYTPMGFIMGITAITIFISFITGIYPSVRAMKIDPLETLRYE